MQKLVEALKRKEREDAAKPKETAETFRAKFAELYGPKKNTAGNDARTRQEREEGSGTDEDTPGTKKPVQARKSGNGKGKGKVRGKGKAGHGRKR